MRSFTGKCAAVALLLAAACGGGPPPTIQIINPTQGATIPLGTDANKSVSVSFAATNFTVTATCNGASACGHVDLFIDGSGCDPPGGTSNAQAVMSPATAIFAACAMPTGMHTLSLELHDSNDGPVKGANGQTASASVQITTQ